MVKKDRWAARYKVRSSSAETSYTVAVDFNGKWGCSCPKWRFQKGSRRDCQHIYWLREALEAIRSRPYKGILYPGGLKSEAAFEWSADLVEIAERLTDVPIGLWTGIVSEWHGGFVFEVPVGVIAFVPLDIYGEGRVPVFA